MSKQIITLSDRAAARVKQIMAQAKEPIVFHLRDPFGSASRLAALREGELAHEWHRQRLSVYIDEPR